ncbi:MAG TPA: imidazoleglycerol-phosphate dehydratase [Proteobacteria bacterium]|nr:imidazoleglycerol-phosphate dehydratase [Pseudomonadota bacterium]
MKRTGQVLRETRETRIEAFVALDEFAFPEVATPIPMFSHLLETVGVHARILLKLEASVVTPADDHHLVEDVGIVFGDALDRALGDRAGIKRFGWAVVPMDGSLVRASIDFSGRPLLVYNLPLEIPCPEGFDLTLMREFFQGFCNSVKCTLHIDLLRGDSDHHRIEAAMKAFAQAIRAAVEIDPRIEGSGIPSSKGVIA